MKSQHKQKTDPMKHCRVDGIRVCTKCGSINIKIDGDMIICNDCNTILCFEHKE